MHLRCCMDILKVHLKCFEGNTGSHLKLHGAIKCESFHSEICTAIETSCTWFPWWTGLPPSRLNIILQVEKKRRSQDRRNDDFFLLFFTPMTHMREKLKKKIFDFYANMKKFVRDQFFALSIKYDRSLSRARYLKVMEIEIK